MMKFKYMIIGLIVLLGTSCSVKKNISNTSDEQSLLNNTTWQIKELAGKAVKDKVNEKVPTLVLNVNEKHYSVITGCNTLNGSFDLSDNKMKFSNGISTMMYCDDMSVEDGFKSILTKISSYKIDGYKLTLLDGNRVIAKLERVVDEKESLVLAGTSWELDLLSEPGIDFKKLFAETKPSLEFLPEGKLSGNASCNRFNTSYKIEGNNISLGSIMTTKMMCPNIEGERVFLNTLSKINKFSHSKDQLLFMIDDIVVMRFKKN